MAGYDPEFKFDAETQSYHMLSPTAAKVAEDVMWSFQRDVEGKMRAALIALGWMPPDVVGEFKAAFRVNMLRRAQPGEDIDAEIDRVFAAMERAP